MRKEPHKNQYPAHQKKNNCYRFFIEKKLVNFFKKNRQKYSALLKKGLALIASWLPNICFAQSSGNGDTLTTYIYNICNYISGPLGVSIGILAIGYYGLEMLAGHATKTKFAAIAIGLGITIGSTYYGKTVLMGGSV